MQEPVQKKCPKCEKDVWQTKAGKLMEPVVIPKEMKKKCEELLGIPLRKMWQVHTCSDTLTD